jgi:membrane associated rhomboid family serine protease
MDLLDDLKRTMKSGDNMSRLLIINTAVFLLVNFVFLIYFLLGITNGHSLTEWLAVPASIPSLLFKPWTIITYMFLHEDFLHILFNMLVLFWFGKIFVELLNQQKLINVYLLGGIAGAVAYIAAYNIFPVFAPSVAVSSALGASASVMAIVIACAAYAPNYRIYLLFVGPVRIGYFALFYVLIDLVSIRVGNPGGHIAHLGGAAFGYWFGRSMVSGTDITAWFGRFLAQLKSLFKPKPKMKVTYKRPVSDYDYNKQRADKQKEMDIILDKIAKSGYESLSKEEKEFLFTQGKK